MAMTIAEALQLLGITMNDLNNLPNVLKAYKKMMLKHHPDKNRSQNATEYAKRLNEARDILVAEANHIEESKRMAAENKKRAQEAEEARKKAEEQKKRAEAAEEARKKAEEQKKAQERDAETERINREAQAKNRRAKEFEKIRTDFKEELDEMIKQATTKLTDELDTAKKVNLLIAREMLDKDYIHKEEKTKMDKERREWVDEKTRMETEKKNAYEKREKVWTEHLDKKMQLCKESYETKEKELKNSHDTKEKSYKETMKNMQEQFEFQLTSNKTMYQTRIRDLEEQLKTEYKKNKKHVHFQRSKQSPDDTDTKQADKGTDKNKRLHPAQETESDEDEQMPKTKKQCIETKRSHKKSGEDDNEHPLLREMRNFIRKEIMPSGESDDRVPSTEILTRFLQTRDETSDNEKNIFQRYSKRLICEIWSNARYTRDGNTRCYKGIKFNNV
jgi:hypothetical protein